MSLYDRMLNIANIDKESIIRKAIENTKRDLDGLDYERMCLVYSSYLYENLKELSCLAYIIDTNDLGFDYKHRFVLVPDNNLYYLVDLTYKQFGKDDDILSKLYNEGYELIDNDKYNYYLSKVTGSEKDITIDESLFREAKGLGK